MELQHKVEIMEAKLLGTVAQTICNKYSIKKAKQFLQVKAEVYMPKINKDTMQALFKVAEYEHAYFKAVEELKLNLYKQRYDIEKNNEVRSEQHD